MLTLLHPPTYQNCLKMYCLLDKKGFVDSQMHTPVPVKCHFKMNVKLKTSRLRYILESTEKGWLFHENQMSYFGCYE